MTDVGIKLHKFLLNIAFKQLNSHIVPLELEGAKLPLYKVAV